MYKPLKSRRESLSLKSKGVWMASGWSHYQKSPQWYRERHQSSKAVSFFFKPPLFWITVSKEKHQKCGVFPCTEGNTILICSRQPNNLAPKWHKKEWLQQSSNSEASFPSWVFWSYYWYSLARFRTPAYLPPLRATTCNGLQMWLSQSVVNKALFGGRQAAWVLNTVNITTISQILKWRWLHQIVSNYRKYHVSNACFTFINFDTGWTENK